MRRALAERGLPKEKRAGAHDQLGTALKHQNKLAEAVAAHRQAIKINPSVAVRASRLLFPPHRTRRITTTSQTRCSRWARAPPAAVASYREAVRLKPGNAIAHCNLGNALDDAGDLPGAVASYTKALS